MRELAEDLVSGLFKRFNEWMTSGAVWLLRGAWHLMSATTEPVLTGSAFSSEYRVMVLIGVSVAAPLLGLAVIQAIAHQDAGGLLRTALLRLPLALLLTAVVVELVSLGLRFTDQASVALLTAGGDPASRAFGHIETAITPISPGAAGFGGVLLIAVVGIVAFILWVELAVRSAAVAVATLFLPLALSGLVWPATAHWARRLGETLAGLVLMKLVMAGVLALAGGALAATAGGVSSVIEGLALLAVTVSAPYALFRLIPVVEGGAGGHLEGVRPRGGVKKAAGLALGGVFGQGGGGGDLGGVSAASAVPDFSRPGGSLFATSVGGGGESPPVGAASPGGPTVEPSAASSSSTSGSSPPAAETASPENRPPTTGRKGEEGWFRHVTADKRRTGST